MLHKIIEINKTNNPPYLLKKCITFWRWKRVFAREKKQRNTATPPPPIAAKNLYRGFHFTLIHVVTLGNSSERGCGWVEWDVKSREARVKYLVEQRKSFSQFILEVLEILRLVRGNQLAKLEKKIFYMQVVWKTKVFERDSTNLLTEWNKENILS